MAEDNTGNGRKPGVLDQVQELKETIQAKAKEQVEELKQPEKTQLYRSIFRVKHDAEPRNRALSVLSNVFFHRHTSSTLERLDTDDMAGDGMCGRE